MEGSIRLFSDHFIDKMGSPWFMTGYQLWKLKLLILSFLFFVPRVHGQCTGDFRDVSADPSQPRCAVVGNSGGLGVQSFPVARFICQQFDPRSDLTKLLRTDILSNHPGFDSTVTYYIGLTSDFPPGTSVDVADCSDYDSQTQPSMSGNACSSPPCNCWTRASGATTTQVDQRNCLDETFPFICGKFDDFPTRMCPAGWVWVRDRCYRYYTGHSAQNFNQAQAACVAEGGNLAKANYYDCNYAAILGRRPDPYINYLVGLMGAAGSEQWRDGTMPISDIFATGVSLNECFLLGDDSVSGELQRVGCAVPAPNFICERVHVFKNCPESRVIETCNNEEKGSWTEPSVIDPSLNVASSNLPDDFLGIGKHTVVYVTEDRYNNVETCTFQIEVRKRQTCSPKLYLLILTSTSTFITFLLLTGCLCLCLRCTKSKSQEASSDKETTPPDILPRRPQIRL